MQSAAAPAEESGGWHARLDLCVATSGPRSVLARRRHAGPLYVQRALYPERDQTAHVMLLHPPGGMVQGDVIDISVVVEPSAKSLITTPSASKFYRTPAGGTAQRVWLDVADDAALEWLPQEAILFDGAHVTNTLSLALGARSRVIAWDMFTLGRPAIAERLRHGGLDAGLEIRLDGRLVLSERSRVPGLAESPVQDASWGLDGAATTGTLVAYRPEGFAAEDLDVIRAQLGDELPTRHGITTVDALLVVRAMGSTGAAVRATLEQAWAVLRPWVYDKPAVVPRIWAT